MYNIQVVMAIPNQVKRLRVVFDSEVVVARMHCATFHPFTVRLI